MRHDSVTSSNNYGPWHVDNIEETLSRLPTRRDDGNPHDFVPIHEKQIEPAPPRQGLLGWAWEGLSRLWGGNQVRKPEQPVVARIAPAQSTTGTEPGTDNIVTRLIKRFAPKLLPYWQFDRKIKSAGAGLLRGLLKNKVGVDFELKDELWQKILGDILLKAAGEITQRRVETDQDIVIPKITIQTPVGEVVIMDVHLNGRLQDCKNDCPLLGHQKHMLSVHVNSLSCSVKIPVQGQAPVGLRISTHNGEINLGTDMLDMIIKPNGKIIKGLLGEGRNSPSTPRDNTALQFKAESVKVSYSDARAMFGIDGRQLPPDNNEDILMAGFDGGIATFSNITLSRQLNCLKTNPDQASQVQIGAMKIENEPSRKAVVNLDSIRVDDLDDDHNGTLSCFVTLTPGHLQRSPSMRWKLLGKLLYGVTTINVRAPIRDGEIKLNQIKCARTKWERLAPFAAKSMGYIEVNSGNPIIKVLLGPLLRSRFTKIIASPSGPRLQLGLPFLRIELQLPGFIPHTGKSGDDGNIILTELLNLIGGDLLKGWNLIPSKLMLTRKNIEKECFEASRGSHQAAFRLIEKHSEFKKRGHHDEALRICLAIPTATYQALIAKCENPVRRAEFYQMAHELTEVDPPKAVAVFAALLARQHYSEEPKTSDPAWLVALAKDLDANQSGTDETITDVLVFAYKSDPFAGADGLKELCRLAAEGRFPERAAYRAGIGSHPCR